MRTRLNAAGVIARRMLFETFITPGYYITLTVSLLSGFALVSGFVSSVGSSGLDRNALTPLYDMLFSFLSGTFGATFTTKVFAEGPFLFALFIAFLPPLLFLALSTAFKFGFEKNVGAIELIVYGPADGTSYCLATLVKNMLVTGLTLVVFFLFFGAAALVNNLVLGPSFFFALFLLFFLSAAVFGYVILASTLTDNAVSSTAIFAFIFILFTFLQAGSFTLVGGYVRTFSEVTATAVKWISPLFYWQTGLDAAGYGNVLLYFINMLMLVVLSLALVFASRLIINKRGVRS